jgi:uncharacterized phiE125 gp8 family phage protein
MNIKQLTYPTTLLIPLDVAKLHLRITDNEQDSVIKDCIRQATGLVEKYTNQKLLSRTFVAYLDEKEFSSYSEIHIWDYPITEITSVKYLDVNSTEQTFAAANYTYDISDSPARIVPTTTGTVLPNSVNQYRVYYTAGFTNTDQIDPELLGWVKIFTGFFFNTRQPEYTGYSVNEIAYKYTEALDKYRKDPIV